MRQEIIEKLKRTYPEGTRVVLIKMKDEQAPPVGTLGTIKGVDDIGSLLVSWDNGSSLNVLYGIDKIKKLDPITTVCFDNTKEWDSREDAIKFFIVCANTSEGSERERYLTIIDKLYAGLNMCSDSKE